MQLIALLGFAALAVAQDTTTTVASASTTSVSLPDNPATRFLTQTNSNGVVTGQPLPDTIIPTQPAADTSQPAVVTTQPAVATIPAGLPAGLNTVPINNFTLTVSVGSSTTVILSSTSSTTSTGTTGGAGTTGGSGTGTGAASTPTPTNNAPPSNKVYLASGALVGAGAFFVAFL